MMFPTKFACVLFLSVNDASSTDLCSVKVKQNPLSQSFNLFGRV